jgi:hypothetical protein
MAPPWHFQQLFSNTGRISALKETGLSAALMGAVVTTAKAKRNLAFRWNGLSDLGWHRASTGIYKSP